MYEPAVQELFECYLSAPAVARTDDDAGLLWETVDDEDGGGAVPGGCFQQCADFF